MPWEPRGGRGPSAWKGRGDFTWEVNFLLDLKDGGVQVTQPSQPLLCSVALRHFVHKKQKNRVVLRNSGTEGAERKSLLWAEECQTLENGWVWEG